MLKIEEIIRDFLKQNTTISDIIVNYNLSLMVRKIKSFVIDDDYGSDVIYIAKECRLGDITLDDIKYNIICDITLEDDEIYFS